MTENSNLTTPRALAERLGYKPHYGNQLAKDGRFVFAPDGKHVLVAESIERFHATKDPSRQGVADRHAAARAKDSQPEAEADDLDDADGLPDPAGSMYNFQGAKAKREHWAAEREHAAWRKEAGDLMERTEVVAAFADVGATLRSKLESWAAVLPPQLEGRDEAAIRATLADQVEQLLRDVSEKFARLASEADHG